MQNKSNRRWFLGQSILVAAGASYSELCTQPAEAMEPISRPFGAKMKLSCAAYSYRKYLQPKNQTPTMTISGFLDECAKMGLGAAEPTSYYFPEPLTEAFLLDFKKKAFLLGMDISGTAVGNTFTHPPGPKREKEINHVKKWIDYAAIFGAPCIRIFSGNSSKGVSEDQSRQWAIESTKIACEYAATRGVFLALENHGGVVADAEGLLTIVRGVESEWFGVNLDTGNFHTKDPYADMAKAAPYAVTVQVKSDVRPAGGTNQAADFERIVSILGESGYRGYLALEYEGKEEPKEAVPRYIEKLQSALAKVG